MTGADWARPGEALLGHEVSVQRALGLPATGLAVDAVPAEGGDPVLPSRSPPSRGDK